MALHKLKLIAPNSQPIVGMKLENGSLTDFTYSYDDDTKTSWYELPLGNTSPIGGSVVLVDSCGKEWDSVDVEFYSLTHRR